MMKKLFLLTLAFLMLLPLTSCGEIETHKDKYTTHKVDEIFDTVVSVIGYAETQEDFDKVSSEIFETLTYYHNLFTIYDEIEGVNNLYLLNRDRSMTADKALLDFLTYGKEMHEKTNGRMNIAMGAVLSLWHDAREHGKNNPVMAILPDSTKLAEAAEHCHIEDLIIDYDTMTVSLSDDQMLLDVGALGKGYAVEMAAKALEDKGICGYLINAGGNVRAIGRRGDKTPWVVGVEDPLTGKDYLTTIEMTSESLVTSGSYFRYYFVNGKKYHHIISPDTLMPSDYFVSLSILTDNSAEADALSTALFTVSYENGLALLENFPDTEVLWLFPDGSVKTTDGFH